MTVVHIDIIHGDHLVRPAPARRVDVSRLRDPLALAAANGRDGARLTWVRSRPVYVLSGKAGDKVVDAANGSPVAPPSESEIRAIAKSTYTGRDHIASATLISEIPGEIRGRKPPLLRVEFEHWNKPTLYFSPTTGELVTRRHELWRIFDFVWMFHSMDYGPADQLQPSAGHHRRRRDGVALGDRLLASVSDDVATRFRVGEGAGPAAEGGNGRHFGKTTLVDPLARLFAHLHRRHGLRWGQ